MEKDARFLSQTVGGDNLKANDNISIGIEQALCHPESWPVIEDSGEVVLTKSLVSA